MKKWPYDFFGQQVKLTVNAYRVLANLPPSASETREAFIAFVEAGNLADRRSCGRVAECELAELVGMHWVPKKAGHWSRK